MGIRFRSQRLQRSCCKYFQRFRVKYNDNSTNREFQQRGGTTKKKKKPSGNFRVEKKMNRKNSLDWINSRCAAAEEKSVLADWSIEISP